jgi:hypothetical protein
MGRGEEDHDPRQDRAVEGATGLQALAARADLSEHYATTAMEIAASAVDEAERAAVEAVVARMDADGVKAPAASKSA